MFHNHRRGMTLIEIIVAIIIAAALTALSIPHLNSVIERFRSYEGRDILRDLYSAQKTYLAEEEVYTDDLTDLQIEISTPKFFLTGCADSGNGVLAAVKRDGDLYELKINTSGDITCNDGGSGWCSKMGYEQGTAPGCGYAALP